MVSYNAGGVIPGPATRVVLEPDECILAPKAGWHCRRPDHLDEVGVCRFEDESTESGRRLASRRAMLSDCDA